MRYCVFSAVLLAACLAVAGQAVCAIIARPVTSDACVVILDADTGKPVEGASVIFLPADRNWPLPEKEAASVKFTQSDATGFAMRPVEIGRKNLSMKFLRQMVTYEFKPNLTIHVEKAGYKPLTADTKYIGETSSKTWKDYDSPLPAEWPAQVFLRDVWLARLDSVKESSVCDATLNVSSITTEPRYGMPGQRFTISVGISYPASLANWISKDPGGKMAVSVFCYELLRHNARLKFGGPNAGNIANGCTWSGEIQAGARAKSGVYPFAIIVGVGHSSIFFWSQGQLVIGSTEAEAKDLYEKNVGALEGKQ